MRKLTIAERRKMQLENFNNKYIHDMETARRLFNSYYRYVALSRRVLELENDSNMYGTRFQIEESEKEERRYNTLKKALEPYNISIFVPWCTPTLAIKDNNGCIIETVIDPILY